MKKIKKILLIIVLILTIGLCACETASSSKAEYDIEFENVPYRITKFKLSDIKLHIKKGDLDMCVNVTEDMISDEDFSKLLIPGEHDITINYKDFSKTIKLTLTNNVAYFNDEYYLSANGLAGEELKLALREIISVTKKTETYDQLRTDLVLTDASKNEGKMICYYCHEEMNGKWDGGVTWNREHVWPQSLGWFETKAAGADIHHLRPAHQSENSSRGNTRYGESQGFYEPKDDVKGDAARILFYMYTRYSEADEYALTRVVENWDMLLRWNQLDPVDDLERQRNDVGYAIQGNRNPFIDHPEYAYYIWNTDYLG